MSRYLALEAEASASDDETEAWLDLVAEAEQEGMDVMDEPSSEEEDDEHHQRSLDAQREAEADAALEQAAMHRYGNGKDELEDESDVEEEQPSPKRRRCLPSASQHSVELDNGVFERLPSRARALVEIDHAAIFNRHHQPFGVPVDMMQTLTEEELGSCLDELYQQWGGDELKDLSLLQAFEFGTKKYPYDSPVHLFSLHRTYLGQLASLVVCLHARKMLDTDRSENFRRVWCVRQIATRLTQYYESVSKNIMARNSGRSNPDFNMVAMTNGIVEDLRNASKIDTATQGEMMVLNEFSFLGLRRRGETLWAPAFAKDENGASVFTNSFEHFYVVEDTDTIEDIIQGFPQFSRVSIYWEHVSHNARTIADRVRSMNNVHLPRLVTNPRYISFKNGQYDLVADVLIPYGCDNVGRTEFSPVTFKDRVLDICDDLRDDQDFRTGKWYEIRKKCPHFFQMLSYQYPAEPVPLNANYNGYKTAELDLRLVLAFLGRLLIPLNLLDKWQKAVAIIGTSNVGKTKLLEFMEDFFGRDVFNLKNNPEEQFGFETAIGKRLCVVEEVSSKSKIAAEMMLGMVCGTKALPVSRKCKSQVDMTWNMPMALVGNSFPSSWPNEQGQTERRFFVSYWDRSVPKHKVSTKLPDLMEEERPYILLLMMRAYHSLVRTLGDEHVNSIIPPDIKRDCSEVIAGTDDVMEFLRQSGLVRFDKHGIQSKKRIPVSVLAQEWFHFKEAKYGRGGKDKRLKKADFQSILEVRAI